MSSPPYHLLTTPLLPTHHIPTRYLPERYIIRHFLYRSYIVLIYFSYTSYIGDIRSIWEVYRKYMRRVLLSRSSTGCGILPVFVQNADCEQYISVFRCFSGFLATRVPIFWLKGVGEGCFAGAGAGGGKNFFCFACTDFQMVRMFCKFFLKKYFASLENGCIFALAFDGKQRC